MTNARVLLSVLLLAPAALAGQAIRLELTTTDQRGAAGWGEPELMVPSTKANKVAAAGTRPKNVIFLLMDTARADAFGPFARPDRIVKTPTYDALAAKSTVFTGAYDNENWTKPSVASYLSGLYPSTPERPTWRSFAACVYCAPDRLGTAERWGEWERKRHDPLLAPWFGDVAEDETADA